MLRQGGTGIDAVAVDKVKDTGRETGLVDHLGIEHGVEWREFARLQDAGRTGRKRRHHLQRDLVDRPVPRRDQAADADRLAQDHVAVR
ncbi:hypothetical protein D9M72_493570 [compost metagenome]